MGFRFVLLDEKILSWLFSLCDGVEELDGGKTFVAKEISFMMCSHIFLLDFILVYL